MGDIKHTPTAIVMDWDGKEWRVYSVVRDEAGSLQSFRIAELGEIDYVSIKSSAHDPKR